jgi:hypothetical protein
MTERLMLGFPRPIRRLFFVNDGESRTFSWTGDRNGQYRKAGTGRLVMDSQAGCKLLTMSV